MIRLYTDVLHFQARVEEVDAAMKAAAEGPMQGYLAYTEEEPVGSDLRGNPHSPVFSAVDTVALDDKCGFMAQRGL
jgi:glyceraldehyde 3-phosphate dehydrogenase